MWGLLPRPLRRGLMMLPCPNKCVERCKTGLCSVIRADQGGSAPVCKLSGRELVLRGWASVNDIRRREGVTGMGIC